jgi:hypothetical protein
MTTNSSHQPKPAPQQNGYNPITLNDVQKPAESTGLDDLGGLNKPWVRWIVAPLLGFIFLYNLRVPIFAPLTIGVLLGCLSVRLGNYARQIAAVPLTLAAIKLTFQIASNLDFAGPNAWAVRSFALDPGFVWLPMFFSVCLVYIPHRDSVTFKIVLASSCILLASGLLPGQGFVAIFYLIDRTLFIAVVVGIFLDLRAYTAPQVQNHLRPAL